MAIFQNGLVLETDELQARKLLQMGFGRSTEKGVRLHPLEAAYLVEKGLLSVSDGQRPLSSFELISEMPAKAKSKSGAAKPASKSALAKSKSSSSSSKSASLSEPPLPLADQYLVFRALRAGGQVVRFTAAPRFWRVLAPGVGRDHERSQSLLMLAGPHWSATLESLERALSVARLMRLELLMAYAKDGRPHLVKVSKPPLDG